MTDQVVNTSSRTKASKVVLFAVTAVLSLAALGYLGRILYVQEIQVRTSWWGIALLIEFIAIAIAILVGFGLGREEFAPRLTWAGRAKGVTYGLLTTACLCWLFGAFLFTTSGSSISVSPNRALIGFDGQVYVAGEAAPRGYITPTVFPILGQQTYPFSLAHVRVLPGTQTLVETRYTVVLTARLKDSGALSREAQRLGYANRDQLNQALWRSITLQTARIAQQINGTAPDTLNSGDVFPVPGSPFFEIVLISVSEDN